MSDELTSLKKKVFKQEEDITELREQSHKFELSLCEVLGELTKVSESQGDLKSEMTKHIDKEELVVTRIYERLESMDSELKNSFKERDEEIVKLRVSQAKMFAYATAAFTVITTVIQIIMRFI